MKTLTLHSAGYLNGRSLRFCSKSCLLIEFDDLKINFQSGTSTRSLRLHLFGSHKANGVGTVFYTTMTFDYKIYPLSFNIISYTVRRSKS